MTTEQLIKKWIVILELLPSIDKKYYDVLANYCEKHFDIEDDTAPGINKLVSALGVFKKLDLSNVIFTDDKDICKPLITAIEVSSYDVQDIRQHIGIDIIEKYNTTMIDEITEYLNKMINDEGGIVINELFSTLDFVKTTNNIEIESYILPKGEYRYKKLDKIMSKL